MQFLKSYLDKMLETKLLCLTIKFIKLGGYPDYLVLVFI